VYSFLDSSHDEKHFHILTIEVWASPDYSISFKDNNIHDPFSFSLYSKATLPLFIHSICIHRDTTAI
ncbi:MAG: hypothetical protein RPT00_00550, partial [Gammaproteobacteria bacterium]